MEFLTFLFTLVVLGVIFVLLFGKDNVKLFWNSIFIEDEEEDEELVEENVKFALETFATNPRPNWSQMPEVVSSGMLKKIDSHEVQLHELMFEIITSEATYLKSLMVLDEVFAQAEEFRINMPEKCVVTRQDRHMIFSNTDDIRKTSERFLSDMVSCWKKSIKLSNICDVITKHAKDHFGCYVNYCSNQEYQNRTVTALRKKPEFSSAVERLEKNENCKMLTLNSFLILPVQRIPRLILLVASICERVDKIDDINRRKSDPVISDNILSIEESSIKKSAMLAMKTLNKVARKSDDGVRRMQQTEQMIQLDKQLDFDKITRIPLISSSRFLVKQGTVTKIVNEATGRNKLFGNTKPSKKTRHLLLFTDIMLLTKKKGDRYKVTDYIQRNKLVIEEIDNVDQYSRVLPHGVPTGCWNLFLLVMLENHEKKQVEEVYSCETASDRARWVEALTPSKVTEEEQVYENWDCPQMKCIKRYIAMEPDELTLELSDVVNVFKKLKDGMFEGERIRDGERGWFPSDHTVEIENDHVRARNTRMKYKLMSATEDYGRSQRRPEGREQTTPVPS